MPQYRMLVTYLPDNELAKDVVANTFYLDTDALPGDSDPQALCEDAAALFSTFRPLPDDLGDTQVRAYDMSHPVPRFPVGDATAASAGGSTAPGPREVALCLSYYAGRNLPRLRGRLYIGPWGSAECTARPSATTIGKLTTLAEGISGLGGINVQWVQYSPTTGDFTNVSDYWVDDEWDTVRSRGLRGVVRTSGTVSG